MNAHDRLRLYLEQRRELGESELVLDELPVDAVLKMIGAPPGKGLSLRVGTDATANTEPGTRFNAPNVAEHASTNKSNIETQPASANPVAPSDPAPRFSNTVSTDWRASLSALNPDVASANSNASSSSEQSPTNAPPSKTPLTGDFEGAPDTVSVTGSLALPSWLTTLGIPIGLSANPRIDSPTSALASASKTIDELAAVIASCRACALGALATNPVPGEGNANADFVCVGEAPGQTEDETGRPFVGAAGQLLTKILGAIQLQREDVFICNVLKHRPPGNRNPAPDEIRACTTYLTRQLELIRPKVILALGTFAAQTLLNTTTSLGKLRGQVHQYQGVPLIVTYHPAALLRNEAWKRPTWDDVKLARRILDAARLNDSAPPTS